MTKRTTANPGRKKRKTRQRLKERYAKKREDAQLAGVIDTVAEGAVRDERVSPAAQGEQPLPELIGTAIRNGWAVPESKKPALVNEMIGIIEDPEMPGAVKVMAHNALRAGDKDQWERDNPELAGKTKGGVKVGVQVNNGIDLKALLADAEAKREQVKQLAEAQDEQGVTNDEEEKQATDER